MDKKDVILRRIFLHFCRLEAYGSNQNFGHNDKSLEEIYNMFILTMFFKIFSRFDHHQRLEDVELRIESP